MYRYQAKAQGQIKIILILENNWKELFGNEHESSPPLWLDHYFEIVVYDGYVKYKEAEIHRSAIMQDFPPPPKKKMAHWQPFWIF